MANVAPPKRSTKGTPPPATKTIANLDKSGRAGLAPLNFKVDEDFKHEFKLYATTHRMSMNALLKEGFRLAKEHMGTK